MCDMLKMHGRAGEYLWQLHVEGQRSISAFAIFGNLICEKRMFQGQNGVQLGAQG